MKKLVALALSVLVGFTAFAETRFNKAYAIRKDSSGVYVIRVFYNGSFHDWFVCQSSEDKNIFYGYESNDKIIIDELIDIAIEY